jgi:hypothetical protein
MFRPCFLLYTLMRQIFGVINKGWFFSFTHFSISSQLFYRFLQNLFFHIPSHSFHRFIWLTAFFYHVLCGFNTFLPLFQLICFFITLALFFYLKIMTEIQSSNVFTCPICGTCGCTYGSTNELLFICICIIFIPNNMTNTPLSQCIRVGRPSGLTVTPEARLQASQFIRRLADASVPYEIKIAELRHEDISQRLARNYILAAERYSCAICTHVIDVPAGSWRKHFATAAHLNAEIALVRGTL